MSLMKRSVINPVLVVSGGLVVLSGFFLMVHYESHFAKAIHQIGGVVLVFFGAIHIVINWKALVISLKGRLSVWVTILIFAVCTAIMLATGKYTSSHNNPAEMFVPVVIAGLGIAVFKVIQTLRKK